MKIGDRVKHEEWGAGTIISVVRAASTTDKRINRLSPNGVGDGVGTEHSNARSRHNGELNIGVRFDNGGPQGFAKHSSNDVRMLKPL